MKEKDLYIGLGCSIAFNIFLAILIVFFEPVCEREHVYTIDQNGNMIDSEEMAVELAFACLNLDYDVEASQNAAYDAEAVYHDAGYEWIVILTPRDSEKNEKKVVLIRRDNKGITILSNEEGRRGFFVPP